MESSYQPSLPSAGQPAVQSSAAPPPFPTLPNVSQSGGFMPQPDVQMPMAQFGVTPGGGYLLRYLNCEVLRYDLPLSELAKLPGSYDPAKDYADILKACRGLGTDNKILIQALANKSPRDLAALSGYFSSQGRDLLDYISKETSGYFRDGLTALIMGPVLYDAKMLNEAFDKPGNDRSEATLTEVLLCRSNEELEIIKGAYHFKYGRQLYDEVVKKVSGSVKKLFIMTLSTQRPPETAPSAKEIDEDVETIFKSNDKKATFTEIFTRRSYIHLSRMITIYKHRNKSLSKVIKKETSGHLRDALLYILHGIKERQNPAQWRDAKRLEKTMAGLGTKNELLVFRLLRAQWNNENLQLVKSSYLRRYSKALDDRIKGEVSGAYRDLMMALASRS
ncbi:hypothetical protein AMATHDRAFT_6104 [Amanita thiersii Skay4041]|uniref:Annexin n=1 Tax=Amanita thiersii Skay4041 TaxID=703135 RepID=A0A2A9NBW5_9AGAR|nr:hypothetical protein AMATHDRAFT_6104 [Amanita thiersii Skay4041]